MQVTSEFSSAFMHNAGEIPSSDIMIMLGHWAASKIQHSVRTIVYAQLMGISHFCSKIKAILVLVLRLNIIILPLDC